MGHLCCNYIYLILHVVHPIIETYEKFLIYLNVFMNDLRSHHIFFLVNKIESSDPTFIFRDGFLELLIRRQYKIHHKVRICGIFMPATMRKSNFASSLKSPRSFIESSFILDYVWFPAPRVPFVGSRGMYWGCYFFKNFLTRLFEVLTLDPSLVNQLKKNSNASQYI